MFVCLLCMESGEMVDHIFLHCPLSLRLWHKLFNLVHMDWVPPRSICDMIIISCRGLRNSNRGKVLWQFACLALMWVVWRERNARIFEGKVRTLEGLWDTIHFLASFWASCTTTFKGAPLNLIQLNWLLVSSSMGMG